MKTSIKTLFVLASFFVSRTAIADTYHCLGEAGTAMTLSMNSVRAGLNLTADDGETFQCTSTSHRVVRPRKGAVQGDYSHCSCVNGFCVGGVGNVCEDAMAAGLLHDGGSLLYAVTGVGRRPGQKK